MNFKKLAASGMLPIRARASAVGSYDRRTHKTRQKTTTAKLRLQEVVVKAKTSTDQFMYAVDECPNYDAQVDMVWAYKARKQPP